MPKNFASKKAEEYAYEHGLSLDDFNEENISKKDVENRIRSRIIPKKKQVKEK